MGAWKGDWAKNGGKTPIWYSDVVLQIPEGTKNPRPGVGRGFNNVPGISLVIGDRTIYFTGPMVRI